MRRTFITSLLLLPLCLLLFACDRDKPTAPPTTAAPPPYSAETALGPGKVTLTLDRTEITTGETIALTLRILYPEKGTLDFRPPEEKLGQFRIAATQTTGPDLVDQTMLAVTHNLTLEPFLAGEYTVESFTFKLTPAPGTEIVTAATAPVTVQVKSLLPAGGGQLDPADIAAPLPAPDIRMWYLLAGGLALILLGAGFLLYRRFRPAKPVVLPPPLPPHIVAEKALIALLARDLVRKGELKTFHIELSGILRHYLEARFQVPAPEQTTEEFLQHIRRSPLLTGQVKETLALFLRRCDLVKFAKHRPFDAETDETVQLCRQIIFDTAPLPSSPQAMDGSSGNTAPVPADGKEGRP